MSRVRRTLTSAVALGTAALLGTVLAAPPASARAGGIGGLWFFDEGAGQVAYDLSFNGNRGQLGTTAGADAADPTWVQLPRLFFLKQSALRFNGAQSVRMADAPSLEPDGVTVLARVRSTGPGAFRYVMSKGAFQCENASYGLFTGGDGGLVFYVSDGTTVFRSADAGAGIWDGAWHTVMGAFDGQSLRLFVDGRQVGATVPAAARVYYGMPNGDDFYVGDYGGPCASPLGFVGDIDAAAVLGTYSPPPGRRAVGVSSEHLPQIGEPIGVERCDVSLTGERSFTPAAVARVVGIVRRSSPSAGPTPHAWRKTP